MYYLNEKKNSGKLFAKEFDNFLVRRFGGSISWWNNRNLAVTPKIADGNMEWAVACTVYTVLWLDFQPAEPQAAERIIV